MKELFKTILGALGWCILGVVLLKLEIGPWWFGWGAVVLSGAAIACSVDKAMEPKEKWSV